VHGILFGFCIVVVVVFFACDAFADREAPDARVCIVYDSRGTEREGGRGAGASARLRLHVVVVSRNGSYLSLSYG
jgi:hypothetical protein